MELLLEMDISKQALIAQKYARAITAYLIAYLRPVFKNTHSDWSSNRIEIFENPIKRCDLSKNDCKVVSGDYECVPKPIPPRKTGYCRADNDPHIRTFDNTFYDVMGTCEYTLVKPSNNNEFEVRIKNYNAWQHSVASMIESVFVTIRHDDGESTEIQLKAGQLQGNYPKKIYSYITNYNSTGGVLSNYGDSVSTVTKADYTLVNSGTVATVTLANGVKVSFKASYWFCEVWVPDEFYNATAGLCGLYNENKAVDLIGADGELYQKNDRLDVFINSWITDDRNCRKDPNPPPVCSNQNIINKCNEISNPDSYFGQCHDFVDPESFTQNCITDLCEMNNGQSICNIYDLYLTTCADAMNATFCDWSRELGCEQSCGKNEEWSDCAGLCSDTPTCEIQDKNDLICPEKEQKSAMCICKDGYVMDGGKCVEATDCGCDLGGVRVPNGYEFLNSECSIRCHRTD